MHTPGETYDLLLSQFTNPELRRANPATLEFGNFKFPESIKNLFQISEYFTIFDPVLGPIAFKLMTYPLTDLVITPPGGEEVIEQRWRTILEEDIPLRARLKEISYDFFTYGNVFIWIRFPAKRFWVPRRKLKDNPGYKTLTVEAIQQERPEDLYDTMQLKFSVRERKLYGHTKKLSFPVVPLDIPVNDISATQIVTFSPYDIELDFIENANKTIYYYKIPGYVKKRILQADPDMLEHQPIDIINAVLKGATYLRFADKAIYHMRGQHFPGGKLYPGWGMPYTIYALKIAQYTEILRKANLILAKRYALPLVVLFPNPVGSTDPARINLTKWLNWIRSSLEKSKKNPATIALAPYPTSAVPLIGGNFKNLSLTSEIMNAAQFEAAALHFSNKFLQGETTFANAVVIARLLRNSFEIYTRELNEFTRFLVKKISIRFGIPEPTKVEWKNPKIVDDLQRLQIMLNLAQAGKLSMDTILEHLDVDPNANYEQLKNEIERDAELMRLRQEKQAEIQGEARAQMELAYQQARSANETPGMAQSLAQLLTQIHPGLAQQFVAQLQQTNPQLAQEIMGLVQELQKRNTTVQVKPEEGTPKGEGNSQG